MFEVESTIREYTLRIVPPYPVYYDVELIKHEFKSVFGKQPYSNSKPHITLIIFKMNTKNERRLLDMIQLIINEKSFQVTLDGFAIFPGSNTLYLDIQPSPELDDLISKVKNLRNFINQLGKDVRYSSHAHMTISKTKNQEMLQKSFQLFKDKKYIASFSVDHLLLTSRLPGKTSSVPVWPSNSH